MTSLWFADMTKITRMLKERVNTLFYLIFKLIFGIYRSPTEFSILWCSILRIL